MTGSTALLGRRGRRGLGVVCLACLAGLGVLGRLPVPGGVAHRPEGLLRVTVAGSTSTLTLPAETALPWTPVRTDAAGRPLVEVLQLSGPAPGASLAAARVDPVTTRLAYQPGRVDPPGMAPQAGVVPPEDRPALVAVFNAGFKLKDIAGGAYADGQLAQPLAAGEATLVIDRHGRGTVQAWRGDAVVPPRSVAAARQNLALVIDRGRMVPGVRRMNDPAWGKARWQGHLTARSGIGVDRSGALVYVAGFGLDLPQLVDGMLQAGVVRGMELDIHAKIPTFEWFDAGSSGLSGGHTLLPDMAQPALKYLVPQDRDFYEVLARSG